MQGLCQKQYLLIFVDFVALLCILETLAEFHLRNLLVSNFAYY